MERKEERKMLNGKTEKLKERKEKKRKQIR